jgi:hypothetical protein
VVAARQDVGEADEEWEHDVEDQERAWAGSVLFGVFITSACSATSCPRPQPPCCGAIAGAQDTMLVNRR